MSKLCMKCQVPLSHNEMALHKKFVNRGATEFMCINRLAEHFKVPPKALEDKIKDFIEQGCALFE